MMFRRRKACGAIILSFALGAFVAMLLPITVLAIIEGVLLLLAGWCFFQC